MTIQDASLQSPNHEYLELNFVGETATGKGNNVQFTMENLHDGSFRQTESRVGITIGRHKPRNWITPIEKWDEVYQLKMKRGYLVTKTKKMEKKLVETGKNSINGIEYSPIPDPSVNEIVSRLLRFTTDALNATYRIKVDDISDEMIRYGSSILNDLATRFPSMSVAEFNNKLKTLYAAVPRRIDNLSKNLAKRKAEFNDIVADEQELFDIMVSRVRSGQQLACCKEKPTVLQAFNLDWRDATEKECQKIKEMLGSNSGQYLKAWRVRNNRTEKNFNDFCQMEHLNEGDGISHLFHGSGTENFWSIVTKGLTINPTGVVISGKMFGNGTYFAPLARKSLGYTSGRGSCWRHGTDATCFLAIYKVATGKHYDVTTSDSSLNWQRLQQKCPGAHCTWAHAGISLRNDEVIVYQDTQSTIEYLIEMSCK